MSRRVTFIATPSASSSCVQILNSFFAVPVLNLDYLPGGMVPVPLTVLTSTDDSITMRMSLYYIDDIEIVQGAENCNTRLKSEFLKTFEGSGEILAVVIEMRENTLYCGLACRSVPFICNILPWEIGRAHV